MRRTKKRLRKQRHHLNDLSMTSLIDTALTLLMVFMIATPAIHNAIKVTLPQGNTQETSAQKPDELVVFIDKNGDFYVNKVKVAKADLIAEIKKVVGSDLEKIVYVKADTAISYGTVIELVDDIKFVGGIKYVALATQKPAQAKSSVA
jgi:biopolymer transport protein ExbD